MTNSCVDIDIGWMSSTFNFVAWIWCYDCSWSKLAMLCAELHQMMSRSSFQPKLRYDFIVLWLLDPNLTLFLYDHFNKLHIFSDIHTNYFNRNWKRHVSLCLKGSWGLNKEYNFVITIREVKAQRRYSCDLAMIR